MVGRLDGIYSLFVLLSIAPSSHPDDGGAIVMYEIHIPTGFLRVSVYYFCVCCSVCSWAFIFVLPFAFCWGCEFLYIPL